MGYIVENDLVVSSLRKSVEKFAAESSTDARPGSIEVLYNASLEKLRLPEAYSDADFPELTINQRDSQKNITITASLLVHLVSLLT